MVNFPVFFTSAVASTEKSSSIFETAPFAMPLFVAKASQMAVFVRAEAAFFFMAFMAFMAAGAAAFMARRIAFAMTIVKGQRLRSADL